MSQSILHKEEPEQNHKQSEVETVWPSFKKRVICSQPRYALVTLNSEILGKTVWRDVRFGLGTITMGFVIELNGDALYGAKAYYSVWVDTKLIGKALLFIGDFKAYVSRKNCVSCFYFKAYGKKT